MVSLMIIILVVILSVIWTWHAVVYNRLFYVPDMCLCTVLIVTVVFIWP